MGEITRLPGHSVVIVFKWHFSMCIQLFRQLQVEDKPGMKYTWPIPCFDKDDNGRDLFLLTELVKITNRAGAVKS